MTGMGIINLKVYVGTANRENLKMYAANLIRRPSETSMFYIYIDHYGADTVSGRLCSFYVYEKALSFRGLSELITVTEDVLNHLFYPQPTLCLRRFVEPSRPSTRKPEKRPPTMQDRENIGTEVTWEKQKTDSTFIVHVRYRQNATWQGEIKWVNRNKTQYFRSSLEMVRLIEEALDREFGETPKPKWDAD